VTTPQLKKLFAKKKVNNFFSDFISPERSVKNSLVNKSQKIEMPISSKARDSFNSPIHIGRAKIETKGTNL